MKGLLSKKHYCYKIHTLLMKSSAYAPPPFLQESQPLYKQKVGVHTMLHLVSRKVVGTPLVGRVQGGYPWKPAPICS